LDSFQNRLTNRPFPGCFQHGRDGRGTKEVVNKAGIFKILKAMDVARLPGRRFPDAGQLGV
jgi:hypothetical protein